MEELASIPKSPPFPVVRKRRKLHDRDRRLEGAARVPKSLATSSHSCVHKEMD
jgi:hypothetical protein